MKNIIICADHDIGFKVVDYVLRQKSNYFKILGIYTTETNHKGFWKPIKNIVNLETLKVFINSELFLRDILEKNVDYIFLISWKHLISEEVIAKVNMGIINLHYSLLPKYRGVYPVNNAIINGEKTTGITYHWVDKNIDLGSIIQQKSLEINSNDTASTLLKRLDALALKEFKKIWLGKKELVQENNISIDKTSVYFSRKDFEFTDKLDLSKEYSALGLLNLIRGKTFKNKSSLYFKNENDEKIFISIKLTKENQK